jgi:5-methylcytosine-specific restriction endonuclease McrA
MTKPSSRPARMAAARAKGRHTDVEWFFLRRFCGNKCVRCGAKRDDGYVERDHITPIYQGGSDAIENIQPSCARCNASKGPEAVDHRPAGWREYLDRKLAE